MKNHSKRMLLTLILCGITLNSGATTLVHVYSLNGNLNDFASDIALQDLGGTLEDSEYVFDLGQGLSVTSAAFSSESYSVELQFSIDAFTQTYTKIVDTSNLQNDDGLYIRNNRVLYYPEIRSGEREISANESVHLVMTRDVQGNTHVYVDGVFQLVVQENSLIVDNTLHFFKDDNVTINENAAGRVSLIRVYDEALTPTQVRALADGGDLLVEKDLAVPGDGLLTLDLSTNSEWLDITQTQNTSVNSINADVGGWLSAGFKVADRVEMNALWHIVGLTAFNEVSEANLPVVENFISLFGCTFFCTGSSPRAIGLYRKLASNIGSVVGISSAMITNSTPPTAEVENCCSVGLDRDEAIWGVHVLRDVVIEDSDGDGINDQIDNCVTQANSDQLDSDFDGYGNRCDGDLNNDGVVNFLDISEWAPSFNTNNNGETDLNADGQTNFLDYVILTGQYLQAPGPSAYRP